MKAIGWGALAAMAVASPVFAAEPEIPFRAGVNFVLAVNAPPEAVVKGAGVIAGDYEMVVAIDSVGADGLRQTAYYDGTDETGVQRRGKVTRTIRAADLASGAVQVHGFHSSDPPDIPGATSLGPSLSFTRSLVEGKDTEYRFRMFANGEVIRGTLRRLPGEVKFPVIVNGRRVELTGIKAQGQLAVGEARAPYEMVVLDHPRHPLSLRIAYGARGAGFPFEPRFAREIVRINFTEDGQRVAQELEKSCRVEVPGIYFDFNLDSIKPESRPALEAIARAVRAAPERRLVIEGHTDDVGGDAYNDDLSSRRAKSVRNALATHIGVDVSRIDTRGFGERKPIESNQTIAGRARNRRVELACAP